MRSSFRLKIATPYDQWSRTVIHSRSDATHQLLVDGALKWRESVSYIDLDFGGNAVLFPHWYPLLSITDGTTLDQSQRMRADYAINSIGIPLI